MLTTTADVVAMLRWGASEKDKYQSQLPAYIEAASEWVERTAGPFESGTQTHTADGGPSVTLPVLAAAVTAVTVGGSPVTEFTVDVNAGIVYGPFTRGRQNVIITYTVGGPVPAPVKLAATMLACHLWEVASQKGPALDNEWTAVPTGFAVPNRVKELLAPYTQMPGFA